MFIEKKYEKERREKDNQTDKIKNILKEKEKAYNSIINQIQDEKQKKEIEFKAYVTSLEKINLDNKKNFELYQENKQKIIQEWIKNINTQNTLQIKNNH